MSEHPRMIRMTDECTCADHPDLAAAMNADPAMGDVPADVPVAVDWWWTPEGRAERLAEVWDEGVIAGFNRQNSTVWDLNPFR